ncbi:MAG: 4-hydroxy-tetrahydrodipicolinate synthase [Nanoarchaeota archaeon]
MFKGVFTALITPFEEDGSIDESALERLVEFQIKNKVDGLVPCGTTGESPTLNHEEHKKVIDLVIEFANGRVPVIAGTGSNSTNEALSLTMHAKESGANASLQVVPYYNKPTQEGFYRHFKKIADEIDLPMIIYNIPGRTGANIETSTLMRLANHKNIIGLKEASGSLPQMMDVLAQKPENFCVLSGDDNLTLPLISVGGVGVISVVSNLIPKEMSEFVHYSLDGDLEKARNLHYKLLPLFKAIFIETNPIPIKSAMAMRGLCKEVYRLPLCEMQTQNREKLRMVLEELEIL